MQKTQTLTFFKCTCVIVVQQIPRKGRCVDEQGRTPKGNDGQFHAKLPGLPLNIRRHLPSLLAAFVQIVANDTTDVETHGDVGHLLFKLILVHDGHRGQREEETNSGAFLS